MDQILIGCDFVVTKVFVVLEFVCVCLFVCSSSMCVHGKCAVPKPSFTIASTYINLHHSDHKR